ncbi:uncharacterized protein F4807DRAFT_328358 [Annulohypoxylon truncatum]|uniref:uncharacterized protein n=1 Tax=Annulohypoxylon truncatum TaxID=327061 RepID=UPI002008A196|nr:uncharacterized protein F4807DRAFT_328358 [Annulohypoxylon truncatum]KAI1204623.1 hypothetical protein F4807DRAFT_328358 [Annulohypoxylon truncatum]
MDHLFDSVLKTSGTSPTLKPPVATMAEDLLTPMTPAPGSASSPAKSDFPAWSTASSQTGTPTIKPGEYRVSPWSGNMPSNSSNATPAIEIGGAAQFGKHGDTPTGGFPATKTHAEKDIDDWEILTKEGDAVDDYQNLALAKTPYGPPYRPDSHFGGRPPAAPQGISYHPMFSAAGMGRGGQPGNPLFGASKPKVEMRKAGLPGAPPIPGFPIYPDIFDMSRNINLLMNERQELRAEIAKLGGLVHKSDDQQQFCFQNYQIEMDNKLESHKNEINWLKDLVTTPSSKGGLRELTIGLGEIQREQNRIKSMVDTYTNRITDTKPLIDDLFAKLKTFEQQLQAKTDNADNADKASDTTDNTKKTSKPKKKAKPNVDQERLRATENDVANLNDDMEDLVGCMEELEADFHGMKKEVFDRLSHCFNHCQHEAECGLDGL